MPAPETHSEELRLLTAAAAGDPQAIRALVSLHQAAVFRHAKFLTDTPEDAEDVLQETFLALLRHLPELRGEAGVRTWLFTVARNAAYHLRHRRGRFVAVESPDLASMALAAGWGADPERMVAHAEQRHLLAAALERLPAEEREILLLRDVEGLPGEAAALLLGLSVPAMKSRLHRARLHLAAQIGRPPDPASTQPEPASAPAPSASQSSPPKGGRP